MCGWQIKLCDVLIIHGPYLNALEVIHNKALYKFTFTILYFTLLCARPKLGGRVSRLVQRQSESFAFCRFRCLLKTRVPARISRRVLTSHQPFNRHFVNKIVFYASV